MGTKRREYVITPEGREARRRGGRKSGAAHAGMKERTGADWLELLGDGGFLTWQSSPHVMWLARRIKTGAGEPTPESEERRRARGHERSLG